MRIYFIGSQSSQIIKIKDNLIEKYSEIIYERRYNKSKKTFNIQELFHENENGKILLNNYNNQKTISFTSKKLKNGKQK